MSDKQRRLPCHLIAGPLGVGKTSAILDYLKHKEDDERIAVLVNDFGANGLDGVILKDEGTPAKGELVVTPVPGGCLCCTSAVFFETHLRELAKSPDIDRIIIEPSGIVMLNQMKAQLLRVGESLALDIQPVVVLINVARFSERLFEQMPYFGMLASEADVLVGNRCDLATEDQVARFLAYANGLDPSEKQVYTTSFARLPVGAFAGGRVNESEMEPAPSDHIHQEHRHSGSREWPVGTCFDHDRLMEGLETWVATHHEQGDERLKGTFNTTQGWKLIEVAQGRLYSRPFSDQDLNRVDWILTGSSGPESIIMEAMVNTEDGSKEHAPDC